MTGDNLSVDGAIFLPPVPGRDLGGVKWCCDVTATVIHSWIITRIILKLIFIQQLVIMEHHLVIIRWFMEHIHGCSSPDDPWSTIISENTTVFRVKLQLDPGCRGGTWGLRAVRFILAVGLWGLAHRGCFHRKHDENPMVFASKVSTNAPFPYREITGGHTWFFFQGGPLKVLCPSGKSMSRAHVWGSMLTLSDGVFVLCTECNKKSISSNEAGQGDLEIYKPLYRNQQYDDASCQEWEVIPTALFRWNMTIRHGIWVYHAWYTLTGILWVHKRPGRES